MNITIEKNGILVIEGAQILPGTYRNFSGAPDKFNPGGGKRYFNFVIDDPEIAQRMADDGWNVKIKPPREEGDTPFCYLKVMVAFPKAGSKAKPLDIAMFKPNGINKLDEDTIGLLDSAFIDYANFTIRPYNWDPNDPTRKAAYINNELHAFIKESNYFASDYDVASEAYPF